MHTRSEDEIEIIGTSIFDTDAKDTMSSFTQSPKLELLPAIDVADGKAVRLLQGEAGSETSYGSPVDAAMDWIDQGAEWIHLVDLDAAFGRGHNSEVLKKVIHAAKNVNIELSGGIRDDDSLENALSMGATRVNLGTAALEDPEWAHACIVKYGEQIAVGLDVRGETLAARGWTKEGGNLWEVLERLEEAGCARYVVTDVTKDGTLQGPNLELLKKVADKTDRPVVASGGVSSLEDIAALRDLVSSGVEGAIIGKALYNQNFTLAAALDLATSS
jgi:1-(5-phosphoribosyl)-5-[(5-phosphoribosylamino)methylideneamino] imidazole-4-carboxamide isomerase/N-(5'phosphoribosyl)anthranilate isomerase